MYIYCIVGKFGGENAWQIYSFQAFYRKKFGEWIDQQQDYSLKLLIWMVLVWQIADDLSYSPNFLPAKLSGYMVCHYACKDQPCEHI